jgi:hypothetical protein
MAVETVAVDHAQVMGDLVRTYLFAESPFIGSNVISGGDAPPVPIIKEITGAEWTGAGKVEFPQVVGGIAIQALTATPVSGSNFSITYVSKDVVDRIAHCIARKNVFEDTNINVFKEMVQNVGEAAANEIDSAIVTNALTGTAGTDFYSLDVSLVGGGKISLANIATAKAKFGDKAGRRRFALVVHSRQA